MRSEARDRPRLTAKGERTRARIVEAAAGLIYERGVAGTSLDDIRSAAGVSGSQLSHYFAGKDELVQAVIGYQAATITGNQRQADLGSPEGLRAWRDMVIAQVKQQPGPGRLPARLARRAAGRDRRAGPRPDRGRIRAVVSRHQRRAAPSSRRRAPPGRHRPGRPRRHPPRRTPRRPPPRPGPARHPPPRNRRRHRPRTRTPQLPGPVGRREASTPGLAPRRAAT